MKIKLYACIVVVTLLHAGCKKIVTKENPDFVGYWETQALIESTGAGSSIYITSDGQGEYSSGELFDLGNGGPNKKVKTNGKVICISGKKFTINEAPVRLGNVGNTWRMKLDDETYYCNKALLLPGHYSCSPRSLCVTNMGTDTIQCTLGTQPWTLAPGTGICTPDAPFGSMIQYTDDNGNGYTWYAVWCDDVEVY